MRQVTRRRPARALGGGARCRCPAHLASPGQAWQTICYRATCNMTPLLWDPDQPRQDGRACFWLQISPMGRPGCMGQPFQASMLADAPTPLLERDESRSRRRWAGHPKPPRSGRACRTRPLRYIDYVFGDGSRVGSSAHDDGGEGAPSGWPKLPGQPFRLRGAGPGAVDTEMGSSPLLAPRVWSCAHTPMSAVRGLHDGASPAARQPEIPGRRPRTVRAAREEANESR